MRTTAFPAVLIRLWTAYWRFVQRFIAEWKQPVAFDWRSTLAIVVGTLLLFPLTSHLPFLGFEWPHYTWGTYDYAYPPWLQLAIKPLSIWDWRTGVVLLQSLLLMTVGVVTMKEAYRQGDHRLSQVGASALALLTPPVPMLMWEGNAAIITLFGLAALPWGLPFALIQPHLTSWALLARRQWTMLGAVFGVFTLVIWGFWPAEMWANTNNSLEHPIAMGWIRLGWPILVIGLAMLPLTNADPLRLMAVGAFILPYVQAAHLVILLPAIGRVRGWRRMLLWACAWLTLLTPGIVTVEAKYVTMIFPLAVWWFLRPKPD